MGTLAAALLMLAALTLSASPAVAGSHAHPCASAAASIDGPQDGAAGIGEASVSVPDTDGACPGAGGASHPLCCAGGACPMMAGVPPSASPLSPPVLSARHGAPGNQRGDGLGPPPDIRPPRIAV